MFEQGWVEQVVESEVKRVPVHTKFWLFAEIWNESIGPRLFKS